MSAPALARGSLRLVGGDLATVIEAAALAFDVPVDVLTGRRRVYPLTVYRHVTMAAARRLGHSFPVIAAAFDARDHTTVINACQRVEADAELDKRARIIAEAVTSTPGEMF